MMHPVWKPAPGRGKAGGLEFTATFDDEIINSPLRVSVYLFPQFSPAHVTISAHGSTRIQPLNPQDINVAAHHLFDLPCMHIRPDVEFIGPGDILQAG
jgi:hypothetical protein